MALSEEAPLRRLSRSRGRASMEPNRHRNASHERYPACSVRIFSAFGALAVSVGIATSAAAQTASEEAPQRHTVDSRDLEMLTQQSGPARQLFDQGEAELAKGDLKAAEAAFAEVRRLAPTLGLPARRHMQVLTELGRKDEALAACKEAITYGRSPIDARACVGAMMSGSSPVALNEMADAVRFMQWAQKLQNQPFGDAAACEIAYRVGDEGMLRHCQKNLRDNAPNHYETQRWATVSLPPEGPLLGIGWLLLGGLGVASVAHAWQRSRAKKAALPALATLCAVALAASNASAQAPAASAPSPMPASSASHPPGASADGLKAGVERDGHWQLSKAFAIDLKDPEKSIPSDEARNKSPLEFGYYLQDLSAEASYAERRQEYANAGRLWATLGKAVPDVGIGFKRACRAYQLAGDVSSAIPQCRQVLEVKGVQLEDFGEHAKVLLSKPKIEPADIVEVDSMVVHLQGDKGDQPAAGIAGAHVGCQLGARLEDVKRLEACTKTLATASPNDPKTLVFQWTLAMLRKDYADARLRIAALKKTAMDPVGVQKLEAATTQASSLWVRVRSDWRYGAGLTVLLLGVVLAIGLRRRRQRRPAPAPMPAQAS
jgi:tetratricopeptide (TPR) repeat protein